MDPNITRLLQAWSGGDQHALAAAMPDLYAELRRMAAARLRNERDATLNPTALVHEALLRLLGGHADFASRAHFLGVGALHMRSVLVDQARARLAAKRGGERTMAACLVLATTRADVNGVVRRRLDARKASFAAMDDVVAATGMEYGGITPVGLPAGWPILVDGAVAASDLVVVGSGRRRSKLLLPGELAGRLPGAEVLDDLATPVAGG